MTSLSFCFLNFFLFSNIHINTFVRFPISFALPATTIFLLSYFLSIFLSVILSSCRFLAHVAALLEIPGASIAFGGTLLPSKEHSIPSCYGSWTPTAINIPIKQLLKKKYFSLCTTEIFGGFQIIVDYKDEELPLVLEALERVDAHLTAAVVSNNVLFQNTVLAHTVNGTTYCGMRARTTGAQTFEFSHFKFLVDKRKLIEIDGKINNFKTSMSFL